MIGFLHGIVTHIFADSCFLDVQGVGYRVFAADSVRRKLVVGEKARLFTYLSVREDALLLYGFYTQDEYDLFIHLISVSGIGPKVAIGILSAVQPGEFSAAVINKNIAFLTKLPGVGKKTAERLVLELKDKLGLFVNVNNFQEINAVQPADDGNQDEAVEALTALGYSQSEAMAAIKKLAKSTSSVEELIKLALKELSRR